MPSDAQKFLLELADRLGKSTFNIEDAQGLREIAAKLESPPAVSLAQQLYTRQQETFAGRLEEFIDYWGNDGRAAGITRDVHVLIQMAQALAQQPLIDRICEINEKLMHPPIFTKDGKVYIYEPKEKS